MMTRGKNHRGIKTSGVMKIHCNWGLLHATLKPRRSETHYLKSSSPIWIDFLLMMKNERRAAASACCSRREGALHTHTYAHLSSKSKNKKNPKVFPPITTFQRGPNDIHRRPVITRHVNTPQDKVKVSGGGWGGGADFILRRCVCVCVWG